MLGNGSLLTQEFPSFSPQASRRETRFKFPNSEIAERRTLNAELKKWLSVTLE